MMHSLFWKIFLSFWFFIILSVLSSTFIIFQFQESIEPQFIPVKKIVGQTHRIERQGGDRLALTEWLSKLKKQNKADRIYIIDSKGEDLLQRQLSVQLREALKNPPEHTARPKRPRRMPPPEFGRPHPMPPGPPISAIIVEKISMADGDYILIIDNQNAKEHWQLLQSFGIRTRIAIASLLSGLICFFLARYLTIPLKKLSSATHQIASGNYKEHIHLSIVDRKDEIGDLGRDFGQMAARIETALFSQQRLLRDVSHELRSPLARLQIALGLARQRSNGLVDPELDRIEHEAERLNDLLGKTLSLVRLSNQVELGNKTRVDLNALLEDAIENAEYEAQSKQCHIIFSTEKHIYLDGNWDLLHSALENILRNAVYYTKEKTAIEVAMTLLKINSNPFVNIKIRDYGSGVPESDIDELFTPFFRVDEARTQHNGGYGIGLAIAERAIHLHDGKINAANVRGGGLEVGVLLPLLI
jgi:two-component system sensor histidine kinase CpxA